MFTPGKMLTSMVLASWLTLGGFGLPVNEAITAETSSAPSTLVAKADEAKKKAGKKKGKKKKGKKGKKKGKKGAKKAAKSQA